MSKKIHRLSEKEEYPFGLAGIASSENDYRLSWALNKTLGINLMRKEDLGIYHKRLDDEQTFSQFEYFNEETLLQYRLISNRSETGSLLEEMTNVDYLLQITGDTDEVWIDNLVKELNNIDEITLAFRIDPESLKSRKKLLQ
jgi:hypothetical protein